MRERPILMKDEMVRAILDDTKTQTRRILKPQPSEVLRKKHFIPIPGEKSWQEIYFPNGKWYLGSDGPYGKQGDRLWVRETWSPIQSGYNVIYRADHTADWNPKWKPSIFMPRSASRINLEITDVRVQRLREITSQAIWYEGAPRSLTVGDQCEWFESLWNSINEKRGFGWDKNPFVWAITFRRLQ